MLPRHEIDVGNSQHIVKLLGWRLHWPRGRCCAWRRLRKCGGHCGVKRNITLHLLHDLMDMAIEHCDRAKSLQHCKGLLAIRCSPSPGWVHSPEWNVCENYNGSAALQPTEVLLQPIKLRLTWLAHALKLDHIDQSDKVDALVIEAVPAISLGALAISIQ